MAVATSNIAADKIRTIAQQAYIYGYAPVYIERQRRNMVSQITAAQTRGVRWL